MAAVVALGAAGAAGAATALLVESDPPAPAVPAPTQSVAADPAGRLTLQDAIAAVEPSVVLIRSGSSQGSGTVVTDRGLIVTNEHVISGQTEAQVETADGRIIPAQVVASDAESDLAILRPASPAGSGVSLADEPDAGLRQGDQVFAIGSPFGLKNSVTVGVVSALRRINGRPLIQTDAPINPGNSGGGLFDLRGRFVGVPTEITSLVPGNVGIGHAVTVERVKTLLDQVQ